MLNEAMMKPTRYPSLLLFTLMVSASGTACASDPLPPLLTVKRVELDRYAGKWNQIAFLPTRFQRNCTIDTTAEYTPRENGTIAVRNECTKRNGKRISIEGVARVENPKSQAELKVKFFWFAPAGDYWIIDLGPNYDYAVVGTPDRKYLWILSRAKVMGRDLYATLIENARRQAFPIEKIEITGKIE